jgi:O-antigen/teichoic acid export membrane protein
MMARSPLSAVLGVWRRHGDLLGNAGSLVASTGVTSLLGVVYWTYAARVFSASAVGFGSAAVSAMTLLGTIGMLGLGTLLIGELPRRTRRAGLVAAALLVCGLGSLVLGVGFAVVAPHVSARFEDMVGTPSRAALFAAGVVVTGVTLVFDQATIGLMRGGLQLWRNTIFSVAKLVTLPVAAVVLHDQFGVGITLSWVAGMALSLALVAVRVRHAGSVVLPRPEWGVLRGLGKTAMAHNWLNLAITMPVSLLPVLVTVIVSPSANAAFYVATMLSAFLFIVPVHLSTVLFAVVAADPQELVRKLRFALRLSYMIGLPGMAILILGSHLALSVFGKGYAAEATLPLCLMAAGYPPAVPKSLYIAVCRASGKVSRAAAVLTTCSTMEIAAAAAGGLVYGLKGLSFALVAVRYAEALVTAPSVIRAAIGRGRHRRAGSLPEAASRYPVREPDPRVRPQRPGVPVPAGRQHRPAYSPALAGTAQRDRQQAGIAVLLSLASFGSSTHPIPIIPDSLLRPPPAREPAGARRPRTPPPRTPPPRTPPPRTPPPRTPPPRTPPPRTPRDR